MKLQVIYYRENSIRFKGTYRLCGKLLILNLRVCGKLPLLFHSACGKRLHKKARWLGKRAYHLTKECSPRAKKRTTSDVQFYH